MKNLGQKLFRKIVKARLYILEDWFGLKKRAGSSGRGCEPGELFSLQNFLQILFSGLIRKVHKRSSSIVISLDLNSLYRSSPFHQRISMLLQIKKLWNTWLTCLKNNFWPIDMCVLTQGSFTDLHMYLPEFLCAVFAKCLCLWHGYPHCFLRQGLGMLRTGLCLQLWSLG